MSRSCLQSFADTAERCNTVLQYTVRVLYVLYCTYCKPRLHYSVRDHFCTVRHHQMEDYGPGWAMPGPASMTIQLCESGTVRCVPYSNVGYWISLVSVGYRTAVLDAYSSRHRVTVPCIVPCVVYSTVGYTCNESRRSTIATSILEHTFKVGSDELHFLSLHCQQGLCPSPCIWSKDDYTVLLLDSENRTVHRSVWVQTAEGQ